MRRIPFLVLLAACVPHDGTVTGSYVSYFSDGSSLVLQELEDGRGLDFSDPDTLNRLGMTPIDCRYLLEEDEGRRLPLTDYATECSNEKDDDQDGVDEPTDADGIDSQTDMQFMTWLYDYPFYKKEGAIEPYRVEAVVTSEHDLQLTVHQTVERIGDFRFGFVVDPLFAPVVCADKEGGGAELVPIDGDWLEQWSAAEDGGTLIHLNSYAYQISPNSGTDYWYLEQDVRAGDSFGRFEDDDFFGHPLDYTQLHSSLYYPEPFYYLSYTGYEDWASILTYTGGAALPAPGRGDSYADWVAAMKEATTYTENEPSDLVRVGKTDFPLEIVVEDNTWRIDESDPVEVEYESSSNGAAGLENWVGLSASFVRFDISPDQLAAIEPGRQDPPLKGSFQIELEGLASASKLFVTATFEIDHIGEDGWGYTPTLDEIKREENQTPDCGEEQLTDGTTSG